MRLEHAPEVPRCSGILLLFDSGGRHTGAARGQTRCRKAMGVLPTDRLITAGCASLAARNSNHRKGRGEEINGVCILSCCNSRIQPAFGAGALPRLARLPCAATLRGQLTRKVTTGHHRRAIVGRRSTSSPYIFRRPFLSSFPSLLWAGPLGGKRC